MIRFLRVIKKIFLNVKTFLIAGDSLLENDKKVFSLLFHSLEKKRHVSTIELSVLAHYLRRLLSKISSSKELRYWIKARITDLNPELLQDGIKQENKIPKKVKALLSFFVFMIQILEMLFVFLLDLNSEGLLIVEKLIGKQIIVGGFFTWWELTWFELPMT